MNPDTISLENISKSFEYEKFSREIDSINDIDEIKKITKCYLKLYLKQQEVLANIN
jgi:hypothetical protein